MKRWLMATATLAGASVCLAPASAYAQQAHFDIPPQSLDDALIAFATQANVSLALPVDGLGNARSSGLDGVYTPNEALAQLLAGSGFRFEPAGDHAFRISAAPRATSAQQAPRATDVIVVTARRRTALQDLPRSLSDVGAHDLDAYGISDSHDLATQVSGLQHTDLGAGRDKLYLRGVSDGALTGRAQSTVGIYLDGVRLTYAAPDPQLALIDVARVDVLRGPQGALYGAGSIGGIVSIESNAPDASGFSGAALAGVEATRGGGVGHDTQVVLNAPLVPNRLAIRLAAYDQQSAGWLDNTNTSTRNTNSTHRSGLRFSTAFDLTPDWRLRAFAVQQGIDSRDSQYLQQTPQGAARRAPFAEPHDNDFLMGGASLHGSTLLGDVDTTTALVRHEINSRFDATGGFATLGVDPARARPMDDTTTLNILVHETRLSAPATAIVPWFVGFFFADGDSQSDRILRDGAPGLWPARAYDEQRTDAIDEVALFGGATWRFTQSLSLSTGLRVFRNQVKTDSRLAEPLLGRAGQTTGKLTESGLAPDIRLAFQPSADLLFYLSAAEGYRSGGFNTGELIGTVLGPAQPLRRFAGDELWTYELGARAALLNNRLRLSAAVFRNDWRRLITDDLISNGLPFTGNVGDARAVGFESDADFKLDDNLSLSAHVLINEPDISRRDPRFPVSADNLPGAPEALVSASLRYQHNVAANLQARGALSVAFVGESNATFSSGAAHDSYTQVDLDLALAATRTELSLAVDNLFDARGATFSLGNPYATGAALITELRPATLSIKLRRRF